MNTDLIADPTLEPSVGVTEAEYNFRTLNLTSSVRSVLPHSPVDASAQSESVSFFRNVTVLLPVIISVIVLCVILATFFGCMRRQHVNQVVNGLNGNNCTHKTDLRQSTETFPLNDFQCGSKPKFIDCQSAPPKGFGNPTSYYSSPHRKSLTSVMAQRSEHQYAEPLTQLNNRCVFADDLNCPNMSSTVGTAVAMPDKMYATIKRSPPIAFT